MATPTASIGGIVRYRSAFLQFLYTDGGSYFPYGGFVDWFIDGDRYGTSNYPAYTEACEGIQIIGLTPGTIYTIMAQVWVYTSADHSNINFGGYLETTLTTGGRPSAFSWTVPKTAGGQYYVGATEWMSLINNIMNVLEYAGYTYSFTQSLPQTGEILTAARYNDLRAAIQSVPGYGYYIPQVSSGQIVTAQQLNLLVSELNAIP